MQPPALPLHHPHLYPLETLRDIYVNILSSLRILSFKSKEIRLFSVYPIGNSFKTRFDTQQLDKQICLSSYFLIIKVVPLKNFNRFPYLVLKNPEYL